MLLMLQKLLFTGIHPHDLRHRALLAAFAAIITCSGLSLFSTAARAEEQTFPAKLSRSEQIQISRLVWNRTGWKQRKLMRAVYAEWQSLVCRCALPPA
jgi:hypothetical protein